MQARTFSAHTSALGDFSLSVQIVETIPTRPLLPSHAADLSFVCNPDIPRQGCRSEVQPHVTAFYDCAGEELVIKLIERNCVMPGQRLLGWFISESMSVRPTMRSVLLDNLMGAEYQRAVDWLSGSGNRQPYHKQSGAGPLVKSLLGAGFSDIRPIRDPRQARVVSLRGVLTCGGISTPATAGC